MTHGPVKMTAQ